MFFRTKQCTRVHRLGVQKTCKNWKKGYVFGHIDKFWNGHDAQLKKNACKNAYLGSIFIPEKYVFRVCFESPFMQMISNFRYKWPPRAGLLDTSLIFYFNVHLLLHFVLLFFTRKVTLTRFDKTEENFKTVIQSFQQYHLLKHHFVLKLCAF